MLLAVPLPAALGGAERYVAELSRALSKHTQVTVHAFELRGECHNGDWASARRHQILRLPFRESERLALPIRAFAEITRADVVHVHQFGTVSSVAVAALSRLRGRSVYVTDHGSGGMRQARRLGLLDLFDGFLEVSEFAARTRPATRRRVIYGGVDTERFRPSSARTDPYLLYVGRIKPHKGLDDVIRALPPGARLVCVGRFDAKQDPGYLDHLQALAAATGADVTWQIDADDDTLSRLYAGARAVVLASVHEDAFGGRHRAPELLGLAVLEGMASGTPAICTNIAAFPEIVEDGVSGVLVPEHDLEALRRAMMLYLDDADRARRDGDNARERVAAAFTWDHVAQRCLSAYAELRRR